MTNPTGTSTNYAFYYDDNGTQTFCLLDPAGNTIDIGVSNLFSKTCSTDTAQYVTGSTVSDYTGPVVPFVMSVPAASTQQSISAEAMHLIFGRGGKAAGTDLMDAAPWTDPTYYFIRNGSAGSTVLTSLMIAVNKVKFWGIDRLYLQAAGQLCGYLPDSNKNSFDKMNVRDGHYPLWGYQHFFTPVGPGGVPSDAAKAFVTKFAVARVDQALIDNIISASLVPQCAMKVIRTGDVSDFAANTGLSCGCYFDFKTTGHTDCRQCQSSGDCPSDHSACNYGYCETN
jgi:hypothetical protein